MRVVAMQLGILSEAANRCCFAPSWVGPAFSVNSSFSRLSVGGFLFQNLWG